ncbi:MAG: hypothetical protein ABSD58_17340 [Verrucomicrobiia bacterium]|jgi:hypothetical protein
MKYTIIIPLLFIAACASQPKLAIRPAPPPAVETVDATRYAEVVRAYYIGRSVDPNHPETMDEQHQVYRVEASAHWDLHPGPQAMANLLNPPSDAAFAPAPTNDALVAEMNRQREVTARVMQEAARLAQALDQLQKCFGEMKTVAGNQALINARLANAELRLDELAKVPESLTTPVLPETNDVPTSISESLDRSKP